VRRLVVFLALVIGALVVPAVAASAHPLGNFTVNQYSGLRVTPSAVDLDLVVDMAEIPTFQAKGEVDAQGAAYAPNQCANLVRHVHVSVDGKPLAVRLQRSDIAFPPGAAGLPTLRLTCSAAAATTEGTRRLAYRDDNYADRVGWREITAVGTGVTLREASVPEASRSARLTAYPNDLLQSPLDQRSATARAEPGGEAASALPTRLEAPVRALPRGVDGPTRAFTSLVARHRLSVGFGLVALGLAVVLGAVHALAPGHGKTVMAAYLVGQRGSVRQAALIGMTVTATHTAGVLALGLALSASALVAPERLYPWLGLASGALLASIGVGLLRRALLSRHQHHHHHHHDHDQEHEHEHGPASADLPPIRTRALVAMGLAGGMVPSPSALVVLLGAMALGRAWFGVVLVVAYGLGMAATLTGAGVLLLRARGALDRTRGRIPSLARVASALPLATSSVIVALGVALAARGAVAI
jgi:ABC-type nickel/cobalt efflux system permease component RcnA